jgi:hypothetical protein
MLRSSKKLNCFEGFLGSLLGDESSYNCRAPVPLKFPASVEKDCLKDGEFPRSSYFGDSGLLESYLEVEEFFREILDKPDSANWKTFLTGEFDFDFDGEPDCGDSQPGEPCDISE